MAIGPALMAALQLFLVWFRHRTDPAEVQYRRLKEIRVDTLEETRDFRMALAGKNSKAIGEEFWALMRRAQGRL